MNATPEIDYEIFEELIRQLRVAGHDTTADKLDFLLHRVAWTTGSELIGELGLEITAFQRSVPDASAEVQHALKRCMSVVRNVWPDIGGSSTAAK